MVLLISTIQWNINRGIILKEILLINVTDLVDFVGAGARLLQDLPPLHPLHDLRVLGPAVGHVAAGEHLWVEAWCKNRLKLRSQIKSLMDSQIEIMFGEISQIRRMTKLTSQQRTPKAQTSDLEENRV